MISVGTILHISDNSGALEARCIKVVGGNPLKKGKVGDLIIVSLTKVKSSKKLAVHQVKKALIIGTIYPIEKHSGIFIKYSKNNIILLDDKRSPIGNRINNYTISNLRLKNYMKIVSLSIGIL